LKKFSRAENFNWTANRIAAITFAVKDLFF